MGYGYSCPKCGARSAGPRSGPCPGCTEFSGCCGAPVEPGRGKDRYSKYCSKCGRSNWSPETLEAEAKEAERLAEEERYRRDREEQERQAPIEEARRRWRERWDQCVEVATVGAWALGCAAAFAVVALGLSFLMVAPSRVETISLGAVCGLGFGLFIGYFRSQGDLHFREHFRLLAASVIVTLGATLSAMLMASDVKNGGVIRGLVGAGTGAILFFILVQVFRALEWLVAVLWTFAEPHVLPLAAKLRARFRARPKPRKPEAIDSGIRHHCVTREGVKAFARAQDPDQFVVCPVCKIDVKAANLVRHCDDNHSEAYVIEFECRKCQHKMHAPRGKAGQHTRCAACKKSQQVPRPSDN